jgi:hypothetical protein
MTHQVEIVTGKSNVNLPNGYPYDAGDVVDLTDEEWERLDKSIVGSHVIDRGELDTSLGVRVRVASGKSNVVFPSGNALDAGEEEVLSLEDFLSLDMDLFPGTIIDVDDHIMRVEIPVDFADIANGTIAEFRPDFDGKVVGFDVVVGVPVTTAAKASTLTLRSGEETLAPTGGSLALASATLTPAGAQVSASAITAERNEKQSITIDAAGGTFDVTLLPGHAGEETLADVDWNVAAAALKTLIVATPSFAAADVDVTGGPGGTAPLVIEFMGEYANEDLPQLTTDATNLTGGAGTATPATTQTGSHTSFDENDEISIVASATTAFVEGSGILRVLLLRNTEA